MVYSERFCVRATVLAFQSQSDRGVLATLADSPGFQVSQTLTTCYVEANPGPLGFIVHTNSERQKIVFIVFKTGMEERCCRGIVQVRAERPGRGEGMDPRLVR